MIGYVNECVGCEVCYGCGKDHTEENICDNCGNVCNDGAFKEEYGSDVYCRTCAKVMVEQTIKDMSDDELFELLGFEEVK